MRDMRYSYESLEKHINRVLYKIYEYGQEFDRNKQDGNEEEAKKYLPRSPENAFIRGRYSLDLGLKWYIMNKPLDDVKQSLIYAVRNYSLSYDDQKEIYSSTNVPCLYNTDYSRFLQVLSVSYLLGYNKEDIISFEKLIRISPTSDILLDTILNAMIDTPISDDVMLSNMYPKLVEVIKEKDVTKAEELLIDFLENDWYNNSKSYPFRELDYSPNSYVGLYSYESAAIAKIKKMDLSKFENVKHFPIDMAYYLEDVNDINPVTNDITEKEIVVDSKTIKFNVTNTKGKDFEYSLIDNLDVSNLKFKDISFKNSDVSNLTFTKCEFENVDFSGSTFYGLTFYKCTLINCTFNDIILERFNSNNTKITNCSFSKAEMFENIFLKNKISDTKFINVGIVEAFFEKCQLTNNNFKNCFMPYLDLRKAKFVENKYENCDASGLKHEKAKKVDDIIKYV